MRAAGKAIWLGVGSAVALLVAAEEAGRVFCRVDDLAMRAVRDLRYVPEKSSILVVGDSTAAFNFNASLLPNAVSAAILGGTSRETYFTMRRYLATHAAPRCVVMALSFRWRSRREEIWKRLARNRFYSIGELNEIYSDSARVGEFPASAQSRAGFLLSSLARGVGWDSGWWPELVSGIAHFRELSTSHEEFLARFTAGKGPVAPDTRRDLTAPDVEHESGATVLDANYFDASLDLARQVGSRVFILPSFFPNDDHEATLARAAHGRPYNYLRVPDTNPPLNDFVKPGHFRGAGAKRLMGVIAPELNLCEDAKP